MSRTGEVGVVLCRFREQKGNPGLYRFQEREADHASYGYDESVAVVLWRYRVAPGVNRIGDCGRWQDTQAAGSSKNVFYQRSVRHTLSRRGQASVRPAAS